ncbi:MAG TPA: glycosyltransferase family 2 protein [Longimicrobium sp.]|uniref:glycosyltransferase family 2 protein n=1 Tax=Longimicrobium sp. TaxID=2029185 RepID=UPI002EDA1654
MSGVAGNLTGASVSGAASMGPDAGPHEDSRLAVGVCTRDRPDALVRCIRSLGAIAGLVGDVIVVDDGSRVPVEPGLREALGPDAPPGLRVLRSEASRGLAAGRNAIVHATASAYVLNLDDDASVVDPAAIHAALAVFDTDPRVGAVALAQGDEQGRAWPAQAQPAPVSVPSRVASFVGYGHVLRRRAMLQVGGYREELVMTGEEKELCLRLLDAGWRVVYLPDAVVAHRADPGGRDMRRYLHLTVRNDVLIALYTLPLPLALGGAMVRLRRYFQMRRGWNVDDPEGFAGVLRRLAPAARVALGARTPVKWSTVREWRRLTQEPAPYPGPDE